jgi:hypothetical protein
MNPCADEKPFDCIRDGRQQLLPVRSPCWEGNFVSHLMPASFEAYAKILHGVSASYENIDNSLTSAEIALLKIPRCQQLESYIRKMREEHTGSRIRWKALAQLIGVPFEQEICHEWFRKVLDDPACWPRFLLGPDEGNLDSEELSALCSQLRQLENDKECYFRFAEIPFVGETKPILFNAVLEELEAGLAKLNYQFTPEYWWPKDRTWCVCSDYDLSFTFVGGPKRLISALLKDAKLETLEVSAQTRIDNEAPLPKTG